LTRDRNQREQQYKSEQIAGLRERSSNLKNEIEATKQKLKLFKTEIERLKNQEQKERTEAEKAELALREANRKYQDKLNGLNKIESEIEAERAEVLQHSTAFERLTEIRRQLENTGERLAERFEGLQREGERAHETFTEYQKDTEKLEKSLAKEREKLANLYAEKQQLVEESNNARNVLQACEKILSDVRDEFSRKRNRLETLQELEEKRAVYAPAVQKIFAEEKRIGVKFLGTLADKLNVEEKAEKAVENIFGSYLQTILLNRKKQRKKQFAF
jgi:chromosome segregation ATPase